MLIVSLIFIVYIFSVIKTYNWLTEEVESNER